MKSRQADDAWREKNPGRTQAGRHTVSAHHLLERDTESMTGVCPIDGIVTIVPFGRGYACKVRADQLQGRHQDAPQAKCWKCETWASADNPLEPDGSCRRCTDELQPGRTTLDWFDEPRSVERIREAAFMLEVEEAGMHVGYPGDPYDVDDFQPVPGWQTIGSPLSAR